MTDNDDAEGAGRQPRRANITSISETTHTSRARAAELLRAAGMRKDKAGTYLFGKACEVIKAAIDPERSIGHTAAATRRRSTTRRPAASLTSAPRRRFTTPRAGEKCRSKPRSSKASSSTARASSTSRPTSRRTLRVGLTGIRAKLATEVIAAPDALAAQQIIDTAIFDALTRLSTLAPSS